jgi:hypothetical protein
MNTKSPFKNKPNTKNGFKEPMLAFSLYLAYQAKFVTEMKSLITNFPT